MTAVIKIGERSNPSSLSKRILDSWRRNFKKEQAGVTVVRVGTVTDRTDTNVHTSLSDRLAQLKEPEPDDYRTIVHVRNDSEPRAREPQRTVIAVEPNRDQPRGPPRAPLEPDVIVSNSSPAISLDSRAMDSRISTPDSRPALPRTPEKAPPEPEPMIVDGCPRRFDPLRSGVMYSEQVPPGIPPPLRQDLNPRNRAARGKGCCPRAPALKWFILVLSILGLSCVVVGIVLGALTVSGTSRLTICLLMIGVGAVLMTVSAIAWRLTSLDPHEPITWSAVFGFRSRERRSASAHPFFTNRSRDIWVHPPLPPAIPPELLWRPPPPSYQASTQEQIVRSFLESQAGMQRVGSPPPTYRSHSSPLPSLSVAQLQAETSLPASSPASPQPAPAPRPSSNSMLNISHISVVDCSGSIPRGFRVRGDLNGRGSQPQESANQVLEQGQELGSVQFRNQSHAEPRTSGAHRTTDNSHSRHSDVPRIPRATIESQRPMDLPPPYPMPERPLRPLMPLFMVPPPRGPMIRIPRPVPLHRRPFSSYV